MAPKRPGPLTGLKVVELGHYIAAPFCTRILADLGAEVIKVEPPGGDPFRGWGEAKDGHSVWFSVHGRNKLSIELDLKQDRETLLKLAARADVLVENMRAGQLERLKIGPDELHAVNPRLVIARISGYGQDGPYRDKPAFGAIGEAMGGLRHLTGHPAGASDLPPPRCGISISDDLAGMYAAIGLLAAVWERDAARKVRRRERPGDRRQPGRFRVQSDGGDVAGIRAGRARAATGRSGDPDGVADQHLSLRRWQMAVRRRQFRSDLRSPDGRRSAGRSWRPTRLMPRTAYAAATGRRSIPPSRPGPARCRRRMPRTILERAEVPCSRLYDIADCADRPAFPGTQGGAIDRRPIDRGDPASWAGHPHGRRGSGRRRAVDGSRGRRAHRFRVAHVAGSASERPVKAASL